jgi:site-specific DNA recombinase
MNQQVNGDEMIGYIWTRESDRFDKEVYSLKSQIEACRAAAEADGVKVEREFRVQFSGRDLHAIPELSELRELVKRAPAEPKRVYCYSQDRLVRGEEAFDIFYLLVEFRRANTEVRFVKNPVDVRSIAGQITTLIAGHEASGEIEKIRDRTMRGKLQRAREGKLPNYGPQKFGYTRNRETGKAEINEREWQILQRIKQLCFVERLSAHEVAKRFNREGAPTPMSLKFGRKTRWWASTITKLLQDVAYTGLGYAQRYRSAKYNSHNNRQRPREEWIEIPGAYPPLFTSEEFELMQQIIKENLGDHQRNEARPYLLRGLVACGLCGRRLYPRWSKSGYKPKSGAAPSVHHYYVCVYGREQGLHETYNRVSVDALEAWIWESFSAWLLDCEEIEGQLLRFRLDGSAVRLQRDRDEAEADFKAKERQQKNLAGQLRDAAPAVARLLHAEIERIEAERESILKRIAELDQRIASAREVSRAAETTTFRSALRQSLESAGFEEKRLALEAFGAVVSINGKDWRLELSAWTESEAGERPAPSLNDAPGRVVTINYRRLEDLPGQQQTAWRQLAERWAALAGQSVQPSIQPQIRYSSAGATAG